MPEGQRHLTHPGRCQIHATGKSGLSDGAVARQLGRARTTVWREVRRNSGRRGYRHKQAQGKVEARRSAASSVPRRMTPELWALARQRLAEGWSPERVSGRMRLEGAPMAGRQWIYVHVHADRKAGGDLWKSLRRRGRKPNRKGGAHAGRVDISGRPARGEGAGRRPGAGTLEGPARGRGCLLPLFFRQPRADAVRRIPGARHPGRKRCRGKRMPHVRAAAEAPRHPLVKEGRQRHAGVEELRPKPQAARPARLAGESGRRRLTSKSWDTPRVTRWG